MPVWSTDFSRFSPDVINVPPLLCPAARFVRQGEVVIDELTRRVANQVSPRAQHCHKVDQAWSVRAGETSVLSPA